MGRWSDLTPNPSPSGEGSLLCEGLNCPLSIRGGLGWRRFERRRRTIQTQLDSVLFAWRDKVPGQQSDRDLPNSLHFSGRRPLRWKLSG